MPSSRWWPTIQRQRSKSSFQEWRGDIHEHRNHSHCRQHISNTMNKSEMSHKVVEEVNTREALDTRDPYGVMINLAFSPRLIWGTPSSQPLITWPTPIVVSNGLPRKIRIGLYFGFIYRDRGRSRICFRPFGECQHNAYSLDHPFWDSQSHCQPKHKVSQMKKSLMRGPYRNEFFSYAHNELMDG
jgi:hypothetical protein